MVKIGKSYSLHFGKDIFIGYKIINIDFEKEESTLERIDDYMGGDNIITLSLKKLKNKRVIRNW